MKAYNISYKTGAKCHKAAHDCMAERMEIRRLRHMKRMCGTMRHCAVLLREHHKKEGMNYEKNRSSHQRR